MNFNIDSDYIFDFNIFKETYKFKNLAQKVIVWGERERDSEREGGSYLTRDQPGCENKATDHKESWVQYFGLSDRRV